MRPTSLVAICLATLLGLSTRAAADDDARLAQAARHQDRAMIATLIEQRALVDVADAEGMTALHWAAHWSDLETVTRLIAAGARPDVANRYGVTPLHEACMVASPAIVRALLDAGADANAVYGEGETPLMVASRTGSLEAVQLLIAHGADVNAAERWRGQTALMLAAVENHGAVAQALVDAGAAVNVRTVEYTFQELTGGAGGIIHDRPQGGLTALILAARQGAREAAMPLLRAGADINAAEPQYGFTALQTAIFNGHYGFARLLLESGADANDGSLYIVLEMRNLARYTNRPNPPASDDGITHLDIARLLVERGADPNAPYTKTVPPRQAQGNINVAPGSTALHRAVRSADVPAVTLLLEAGAEPSRRLADGSTPLMLAAGLAAPRGGDEEATDAGERNDPLDVIRMLVGRGADVNATNDNGMTPMHYAVQRGVARTIELLAAHGGKFDLQNKQGRTPLDLARGATLELVKALVDGRQR